MTASNRPGGRVRLSNRGIVVLAIVVAVLINAGFSFWLVESNNSAMAAQQRASQRAGARIEAELCHTFESLYADKPPAGNPATNPSRAYLQELHARLGEVPPDLKCTPGGTDGRAG